MANDVVGIDIVARLDGFRAELAKIPDIGGKEAKALTAQLSREIKAAEKASKGAAEQSKRTASAFRDQGRASKEASGAALAQSRSMSGLGMTLAKTAISLEAIKKGFQLASQGMKATWDRARELDDVMGGDLGPAVDDLSTAAQGLFDQGVSPLLPALVSLTDQATAFLTAIADTGAFARFAGDLADAALGAAALARAFLGLNGAEKQAEKDLESRRGMVQFWADEVDRLKKGTEFAAIPGMAAFIDVDTAALANAQAQLAKWKDGLRGFSGGGSGNFGGSRRSASTPSSSSSSRPAPAAATALDNKPPAVAVDAVGAAMRALADATAAVERASESSTEAVRRGAAEQLAAVEEALAEVWASEDAAITDLLSAEEQAARARQTIAADMYEALAVLRDADAAAELEAIHAAGAARKEQLDSNLAAAAAVAGAESDLITAVADLVITAEGLKGKERERAMRAAWEASTAFAIAEAAINIPLSISQAAAAPWPASIGFMIAAGAASTAALVGVIAKAAAGPQFHRGGLAPDETQARLLRGEGVLTPQAVASVGGREGVSRLNAGGGGDERPMYVVNQIGSRTYDAMVTRSLDSEGPFKSLVRGLTGRPGSWRPYARA